jgi:FkbM family methyltransferase
MGAITRAVIDAVVRIRPEWALASACRMLGVDTVRVRLPPTSPLYRSPGGEAVTLPVDQHILPIVIRQKRWQTEEVAFFVGHAPPEPTVLIDVGANCGLVTRQLLHASGSIAAAVCFEPHPTNFAALQSNLAHLDRCHLHQLALGSSDGEMRFYEDVTNAGNYSMNVAAMADYGYRTTSVRCVRATEDAVLGALPASLRGLPLLWKSDTQGFDELIMATLPDSFWGRVQVGIMELWRIERPAFDRARLSAILAQFPVRRFGNEPARNVSVEEVLEYSAGRDQRFRDLHFARR